MSSLLPGATAMPEHHPMSPPLRCDGGCSALHAWCTRKWRKGAAGSASVHVPNASGDALAAR
eukprot:13159772-Alexandrium_andersonii.AAC.1